MCEIGLEVDQPDESTYLLVAGPGNRIQQPLSRNKPCAMYSCQFRIIILDTFSLSPSSTYQVRVGQNLISC